MKVTQGLIIDEPWIGHILDGRKVWEMRSKPTSKRGWFGLIRKGSGQVVGVARLADCGKSLSRSEMLAPINHHRIPAAMINSGKVDKWHVPWKLADVQVLAKPVSYVHKRGAVIWVDLSSEVSEKIAEAFNEMPITDHTTPTSPSRTVSPNLIRSVEPAAFPTAVARPVARPARSIDLPEEHPGKVLGRSQLTGGNLRNNHFYVGEFIDKFPQDTLGGKNKSHAAMREISIDWGGPSTVLSDIDKIKRIFRQRRWVKEFFASSGAREGDTVVVTSTGSYSVHIHLERNGRS